MAAGMRAVPKWRKGGIIMFLTSQAAALHKGSKPNSNQDSSKNEHSRSKHATMQSKSHIFSKAQSFDCGGYHTICKSTKKEPPCQESLPKSAPGSPIAARKAVMTANHLSAIISPKSTMRKSPTLSRSFGSTERFREYAAVDEKNQLTPSRLSRNIARSFHNIESTGIKNPNLLYVQDICLQKSSSLPELSAGLRIPSLSRMINDDVESVHRKSSDAFPFTQETEISPRGKETELPEASLNDRWNTKLMKIDETVSSNIPNTRNSEAKGSIKTKDRIIPLHASAIFTYKKNSHKAQGHQKSKRIINKRFCSKNVLAQQGCFAYGVGLQNATTGQAAEFYIEIDEEILVEDIEVKVSGPRPQPPKITVKQTKKGKYQVKYFPTIVGPYKISIKRHDIHIDGSPFTSSAICNAANIWILA